MLQFLCPSVENSLGLSLKIPICYRNRCCVLVTLREGQRFVSEIQLSGAQLDGTNIFWCHEPGRPESENFDLVSQDED
ncbi:hypothetical protein T08_15132 [Trichinella sp. T8]|nr:hypothetical protein T08_15132 [Trichinella sp. T8]